MEGSAGIIYNSFKVRFEPISARLYVNAKGQLKTHAIANGMVPVNDVFLPYWNNRDKILFLYGGFGSGKSVFAVDKLINHALKDPYFRCFYGRKIYDTIRESVFKTFTDRIEELGIQHLFMYSKADNSTMVIRCRLNGATFTPFGSNEPDSMKSIKDPSHIFCEEFDKFTEEDFRVLFSRLRTIKAKSQFIACFNTEKVFDTHWIRKTFFSDITEDAAHKFSKYTIQKVFCNYTDNEFLDKEEYEQTLWISAAFKEERFLAISAGEWGTEEKNNTFIYRFREKKTEKKIPGYAHISPDVMEFDYNRPIILSFDFNVDPITCLAIQEDDGEMINGEWVEGVRIIQEYRLPNSDIFELCAQIYTDHPGAEFEVTGDATGKSRSALTRGNRSYYEIIKAELELSDQQFRVPSVNPSVKESRNLTNSLFARHRKYLINRSCSYLLDDIRFVEVDETGNMNQKKDKHRTHLLACLLYYNWNYHYNFIRDLRNAAKTGEKFEP